MMEFQKFWKNKERMCKYIHCGECSLNKEDISCKEFICKYPEEAEEVVRAWVEKHPAQTNRDKFREVFGKHEQVCCPPHLKCNKPCSTCMKWWDEEYISQKENK